MEADQLSEDFMLVSNTVFKKELRLCNTCKLKAVCGHGSERNGCLRFYRRNGEDATPAFFLDFYILPNGKAIMSKPCFGFSFLVDYGENSAKNLFEEVSKP